MIASVFHGSQTDCFEDYESAPLKGSFSSRDSGEAFYFYGDEIGDIAKAVSAHAECETYAIVYRGEWPAFDVYNDGSYRAR